MGLGGGGGGGYWWYMSHCSSQIVLYGASLYVFVLESFGNIWWIGFGSPKQLNGLLHNDVERNAQTGLSHCLSCGMECSSSCFYWVLSDAIDWSPGPADCCLDPSSSLTCISSFVASSECHRLIKGNSCHPMANYCPTLLFTCTNYFDIWTLPLIAVHTL